MLGVTRLLCGASQPGDGLRYHAAPLSAASGRRPIVVWNCTLRCNLHCAHCYIDAKNAPRSDELSSSEAKTMIDGLADYQAPVLLFSGGEPLLREDLLELGVYASTRGLRTVISTNGVLIDTSAAAAIKQAGFSYVGVSLDGVGESNDRFRGQRGAFLAALEGIRNCRAAGVRVGLRFTLCRRNLTDLPAIFDLLEKEKIPRACFYHLVYSGRGRQMLEEDLSREDSRRAVEMIFNKAQDFHQRGLETEILTVDNHCDGVLLLQKVQREQPERVAEVLELLRRNGGNQSGVAIGCIGPTGEVHADQFWRQHSFGNIRQRPFGEIWEDTSQPLLAGLKNRRALLQGRCGKCQYIDICNGNFRARAEAVYGEVWAPDPACYLTDEEIGLQQ